GKALLVWYGLALVSFAFLVLPLVTGLVVSLLTWLIQSGPWVGAAVTPEVRMRSAVWVAFLLVVGGLTLTLWRKASAATKPASHSPAMHSRSLSPGNPP